MMCDIVNYRILHDEKAVYSRRLPTVFHYFSQSPNFRRLRFNRKLWESWIRVTFSSLTEIHPPTWSDGDRSEVLVINSLFLTEVVDRVSSALYSAHLIAAETTQYMFLTTSHTVRFLNANSTRDVFAGLRHGISSYHLLPLWSLKE